MRLVNDQYNELAYYTLSHPNPSFIHQHVVDAFAAQNADKRSKPITVAFGLVGLYLYLEKGLTGKQVQQAHTQLAIRRKSWPKLTLPETRGSITAADVIKAPVGVERDEMIRRWCASVWSAWSKSHDDIISLIPDDLSFK